MITRMAHICLQVKDIQRTIAFYRDGLEFPITFTFKKAGKLKGAYFSIGNRSFIEVFEVDNPVQSNSHFCLETDDMDGLIAMATAKGIVCSPKMLGCDHSWQTWLRDPDGNPFEIHEYTERSRQFCGGECEISW